MIKDIIFGQYYDSKSPIHKMDPRMKVILTVFYIVLLFCVQNFWGFLVTGILMAAIVLISKIPLKIVIKSWFIRQRYK